MSVSLISIHDVMPHTLVQVDAIVERLRAAGHQRITLLVVPGLEWQADEIAQLRRWSDEGLELAAHGWYHHADNIRGFYHRLHALLLSRNVAEHLALSPDGIKQLMQDSYDWFEQAGLPAPYSYVPPAWALGKIPDSQLKSLPYGCVETLSGFIRPENGGRSAIPVVGFEADNPLRALFLKAWNGLQIQRAKHNGALRVAIHPDDFALGVATQLNALINTIEKSQCYRDYCTQPPSKKMAASAAGYR